MRSIRDTTALVLLAVLAGTGFAQTTTSRIDARAELVQAQRNGDLVPAGEEGLTLRQLHPERYAPQARVATMSRDDVRAELARATRTGELLAVGEQDLMERDLRPDLYPAAAAGPTKTRAQVQAELRDAIRTGNVLDSTGDMLLREHYPQRYSAAGMRTAGVVKTDQHAAN